MILSGATDKLQVVTDATADIEVSRSWAHNNAGTITADGGPLASITSATTTDILTAAGASQQRSVRQITIRNSHASTACTVTVQRTDGTNTTNEFKAVLAAGESLIYGQNGIWVYYDANGKPYMGLGPLATQADMEAASSLTVLTTPGRQHFHPGHPKFVCMTTGTATPSMQTPPSYNMTSITDSGVGRLTVTIATDFSGTAWCCQTTHENVSTTLTAAGGNTMYDFIRQATLAAGTVEVNAADFTTVITHALRDPVSWHVVGWGDHA